MAKRFAVKLTDEALVLAMKTKADEQRVPIVQWVTEAIRQILAVGASGAAGGCVVCLERRNNNRERYRRKRQNAGKPERLKAAPFRTTGILLPRTCPLCDTVFTPPIRAQHQKYCNDLCTRYVFTHGQDIAKARVAYAAFMLRKQKGSLR